MATKSCPKWDLIQKSMFGKGFRYIKGSLHKGRNTVCVQGALLLGMDPDARQKARQASTLDNIDRQQDVERRYNLPSSIVDNIPEVNDGVRERHIRETVFSWMWLKSDKTRMEAVRHLFNGASLTHRNVDRIKFKDSAFEKLKGKLPYHYREAIRRATEKIGKLDNSDRAVLEPAVYEMLMPALDPEKAKAFEDLGAVCSLFKAKVITSDMSCKFQKLPVPKKPAKKYMVKKK